MKHAKQYRGGDDVMRSRDAHREHLRQCAREWRRRYPRSLAVEAHARRIESRAKSLA